MKSTIIRLITAMVLMMMALASAWISGFLCGKEKGFEEGKQEGFHEGKLHQILEECKEILDKKLKDKETEKKEKTESNIKLV